MRAVDQPPEPPKNRKRWHTWVIVAGVLGLFVAAAAGQDSIERTEQSSGTQTGRVVIVRDSIAMERIGGEAVVVSGRVENAGDVPVRLVEVRATAVTQDGAVINTSTSYADSDVIAPGDTATFSVYIDDPEGLVADGRVRLEGWRE